MDLLPLGAVAVEVLRDLAEAVARFDSVSLPAAWSSCRTSAAYIREVGRAARASRTRSTARAPDIRKVGVVVRAHVRTLTRKKLTGMGQNLCPVSSASPRLNGLGALWQIRDWGHEPALEY